VHPEQRSSFGKLRHRYSTRTCAEMPSTSGTALEGASGETACEADLGGIQRDDRAVGSHADPAADRVSRRPPKAIRTRSVT